MGLDGFVEADGLVARGEDFVLFAEGGNEVLTSAIPKTVEAVEAAVGSA